MREEAETCTRELGTFTEAAPEKTEFRFFLSTYLFPMLPAAMDLRTAGEVEMVEMEVEAFFMATTILGIRRGRHGEGA